MYPEWKPPFCKNFEKYNRPLISKHVNWLTMNWQPALKPNFKGSKFFKSPFLPKDSTLTKYFRVK